MVAGPIPAIDVALVVPVPFLSVIATIQQGREEKYANADYLRSYKSPTPGLTNGGRDEAGASWLSAPAFYVSATMRRCGASGVWLEQGSTIQCERTEGAK
ncbi:uncharacterized protein SCHCODRAFT_01039195 [Schizophyllum commune H4-8]|uniref:uncharacterized protein n=1 Tax=Schizophyllum commune (strain H4-8 / FGSC 9210) TaxID=578458 RepID=UPI00215F3233|nr:uncharacterized protein SCHCODRAFT_01039195 [Schizophyllum commune H4-8]KAI5888275.1 hypothetical protein SCHCODRAFT_01039195 [Schizophyllum commune H4-8]